MQALVSVGDGNARWEEFHDIPERFVLSHDWRSYEDYIGVKLFEIQFTEGDRLTVKREGESFVEV